MITKEQCRAARGLLNWTQQHLADAAALSKTAINNFERGVKDVRGESLLAIRAAFEKHDIEFIGDYGVHKRRDTVRILKGDDTLPHLWDDIYETLVNTGGEVLIANLDEERSHNAHPDKLKSHLERLTRARITERLLCREGDRYFLQPENYYRWLPRAGYESGMTTFIYGGKVALQLWNESMIILIHSRSAFEAEAQRFEILWKNSIIPTHDITP